MASDIKIGKESAPPTQKIGYTTVSAVADFLGVSRPTIYNLMGSGDLPFAKFGRSRRLRWADVYAYCERVRVDATKSA